MRLPRPGPSSARKKRLVRLALLASAVPLAAVAWFVVRSCAAPAEPTPEDSQAPRLALVSAPAPRPKETITFEQGCLTSRCHNDFRVAPARHATTQAGECQACHKPDAGGHTYPLLRDKSELCSSCHDTRWHSPFQHAAMTADACLTCHDPHAAGTPDLLRAASVEATCAQCHPRSEGLVVHQPFIGDRCELCHEPHGSDQPGLLRASSVVENCRECHPGTVSKAEMATHSHAAAEGSCLACHAPHAAPAKGLLMAPAGDSCLGCHKDISAQITGATVSHEAVLTGDQCMRCHDPHGTDRVAMLRDKQAAVCLSCHDKQLIAADGRTIPSIAALVTQPAPHDVKGHHECSGCHSVHGGNHARLLLAVNEQVPLGPFDMRNYALCFSCHDSGLATSAASTQFRDGDRNLHELHLNRGDNSRGCSACHSVHAVGEPRLIAETVDFEGSGWAMPMGFELTTDGGRCGAACHEPFEYSRRPGGARASSNGGAQ